MPRIIVITGTDTGAGKTVLTSLLARHLTAAGQPVAALKPICSGGRDDARLLRAACGNHLSLDVVNPWHYKAALAPVLAARKEKKTIQLKEVVTHIRDVAHGFPLVFVEGAGGILSPLGEHFSTRDLINALTADVIIAAPNKLGVINHIRLTMEALAPLPRARARIALFNPEKPTTASRTNPALLAEYLPPDRITQLPWLPEKALHAKSALPKSAIKSLSLLLAHP